MPLSLLNNVSVVLSTVTQSCQSQLATGEKTVAFTSTNLRVLTTLQSTSEIPGTSYSPPLTDFETFNGYAVGHVNFDVSNVLASTYGLSVIQYNNNPLGLITNSTSLNVQTLPYEFSVVSSTVGGRRLVSDVHELSSLLVLLNKEPIEYSSRESTNLVFKCFELHSHNQSLVYDVLCPGGLEYQLRCPTNFKGYYNITCPGYSMVPQCTVYDETYFVPSSKCTVLDYNSINTTCLCSSGTTTASRALTTASLQSLGSASVNQYASDYRVITVPFSKAFIRVDDLGTPSKTGYVAAALYSLAILLLIAFATRWVWHRRNEYRTMKMISAVAPQKAYRQIADFFLGLISVDLNTIVSWKQYYAQVLAVDHSVVSVFVLDQAQHVSGRTLNTQKRVIVSLGRVLTVLFLSVVVARLFYADNGQCHDLHSLEDCENTYASGIALMMPRLHVCEWNEYHQVCLYVSQHAKNSSYHILLFTSVIVCVAWLYNRLFDVILLEAFDFWFDVTLHRDSHQQLKLKRKAATLKKVRNIGKYSKEESKSTEETNVALFTAEQKQYLQYKDLDEFRHEESFRWKFLLTTRLICQQDFGEFSTPSSEADFLFNHLLSVEKERHLFKVFADVFRKFKMHKMLSRYEKLCSGSGLNKRNMLHLIMVARTSAFQVNNRMQDLSNHSERRQVDQYQEMLLMKEFLIDLVPSNVSKYRLSSGCYRHLAVKWLLDPHVVKGSSMHTWSSLYTIDWSESGTKTDIFDRVGLVYRYACVMLSVCHFVLLSYYIATSDGAIVSTNGAFWILTVIISLIEYFVLLESVVILIKRVVVVRLLLVRVIMECVSSFQKRVKLILMRSTGLVRNSHTLIQHLNPACRAARLYSHLPVARLLLSVSDADVAEEPRRRRPNIVWTKFNSLCILFFSRTPLIVVDLLTDFFVFTVCNCLIFGFYFLAVRVSVAVSISLACLIFVLLLFVAFSNRWDRPVAATAEMVHSNATKRFDDTVSQKLKAKPKPRTSLLSVVRPEASMMTQLVESEIPHLDAGSTVIKENPSVSVPPVDYQKSVNSDLHKTILKHNPTGRRQLPPITDYRRRIEEAKAFKRRAELAQGVYQDKDAGSLMLGGDLDMQTASYVMGGAPDFTSQADWIPESGLHLASSVELMQASRMMSVDHTLYTTKAFDDQSFVNNAESVAETGETRSRARGYKRQPTKFLERPLPPATSSVIDSLAPSEAVLPRPVYSPSRMHRYKSPARSRLTSQQPLEFQQSVGPGGHSNEVRREVISSGLGQTHAGVLLASMTSDEVPDFNILNLNEDPSPSEIMSMSQLTVLTPMNRQALMYHAPGGRQSEGYAMRKHKRIKQNNNNNNNNNNTVV